MGDVVTYALFGALACRYDLHTPPHHYQHDHAFVLELARERCPGGGSLLDVGCGTGVFLEKARMAGFKATGLDRSPQMIAECNRRLGSGVARVARMEDLADSAQHDVISALSWTLNYVDTDASIVDVVKRIACALRPQGVAILQVAHAANARGDVLVDSEPDPDDGGQVVTFIYRFRATDPTTLAAEYVYARPYANELACETHLLRAADATLVTRACHVAGLSNVTVFDSWRRDPFGGSVSPFVVASRP